MAWYDWPSESEIKAWADKTRTSAITGLSLGGGGVALKAADLLKVAGLGAVGAAFAGLAGYLSGVGSTVGSFTTSTTPRSELGNMSYQQYGSQQMGTGLMTGYGVQYLENLKAQSKYEQEQWEIEQEQKRLEREAYKQAQVDLIYAEQKARFDSYNLYPVNYNSQSTTTSSNIKLPRNIIIR